MDTSRRLLPPIAALAAFDVAARTGGFGRAAAALSLTQGAVSRQIATLESWLGVSLFERVGRGVVLTSTGEDYAREVSKALEAIRSATASVMARTDAGATVEIAVLPTFGMRWLAPRLPDLMSREPGLVVNFSARLSPFEFRAERFDGAIHYGEASWPGAVVERLVGEEMIPVGSPALAARVAAGEDIQDLPLLGLASRPYAWNRWFAAAGQQPRPRLSRPAVFDQFMMMAQAAAAGAGAALAPRFLIEPEMAAGALARLSDVSLKTQEAYYLVYPSERLDRPAFRAFRDWLIETAAVWEAGEAATVDGR
jgi:LysR family glycine cleavage system transcriptional activator